MKRIPIFTFHAIDAQGDALSMPSRIFDTFMRHLAEAGIRGTTLTQQMTGAEQSCALTFDDGYESLYKEGLPTLNRYGFTGTVFVTIGADGSIPSMEGRTMLNWPQIKTLHEAGFEIGAHTLTHPDLTRLDTTALQREVVDAKHIMEDRLGFAIDTFAYPFGYYNQPSAELVARHYRYAVTTDLRFASESDPPHLLPRIETYYLRAEPFQQLIASSRLPAYLRLCAVRRNLKAALS